MVSTGTHHFWKWWVPPNFGESQSKACMRKKYVGEKCGKLHITYILCSQRGITPSKIDAKWRHSNLICSTLKQSHVQNFSSICQSMYEKSAENGRTETRTDGESDGRRVGWTESRTDGDPDGRRPGRTDGHHHTIIRPVWRQAYNKNEGDLIQKWGRIG